MDYCDLMDYCDKISNTSSFKINWVFLVGGQNYPPPPPYETLGFGGPLPLQSLTCLAESLPTTQIYRVWEMQSTGKCLKSNKVCTTHCLALKSKDRT